MCIRYTMQTCLDWNSAAPPEYKSEASTQP